MIDSPHIGDMLKAYVKEKRIFKAAWARQMGISPSAVEGFVKNPNAKVDTLFKICQVLNYNFIADIAAQLPGLPHQNSAIPNEELEALKKENEKLKMEVEILREVVGVMKK